MNEKDTLCKASISLSWLVGVSVCTYWGWLEPIVENFGRYLEEDLKEITNEDNKVEVEWAGLINYDDIYIDYNYDEHLYDYFTECFRDTIESDKLKEALAKYGIIFHRVEFYKHKWEYNYATDSLDMLYEYDYETKWQEKCTDLIPYVRNYIDNVRKKSCDWYVSFEPTTIDEVEMNDTAYIYAIFDKEWLFDGVKESVQDWVYKCNIEWYDDYDRSVIHIKKDWNIDWDTAYYVDINNKTLKVDLDYKNNNND